ncbi:hypothetical protein [Streptomyces sp. NK08204]|uniref:hypothetical protein n=1 Tax=Streptomyces sp. NK08204 TaxID=2873260 RepID=UPI001CECB6D2|nr:hypothetical protein [Streptomyces sp. NK08204]
MEQRIGSSSKPLKGEPVTGAGFDPAFIPGLTGPAPAPAPEDAKRGPEPETAEAGTTEAAPVEKPVAQEETVTDADDAPQDAAGDGPVFEASDRRARIVADHKGVRLSLDEEACEFRWDEIAAVETESPRFGKRFTITVHTPDRRWYPIEIEATARAGFKEWESQLDEVLDAYFEEA